MKTLLSTMKIYCILALTIGFTLTTSISLAEGGGVDTGGGSLVTTVTGETGLIDYFTHAPDLFAKPDQRPILHVPKTKSLSGELGIDKIDLKSLGAWQPLFERIERWRPSSPIMAEYLESSLNNIAIFFVNENLDIVDQRYFIPENLKSKVAYLNTVALYLKDIGLVISKPEFEKMRYEDQLGLLMKEILRHIQITYETDFSAEQLQHLNATLTIGPKNKETLDSVSYYSEKMLEKILDQKRNEAAKEELIKNTCAYSQKYKVDLCKNTESTASFIEKLFVRLEQTMNPDEAFELRLIIRKAFLVLDGNIVNNLKHQDSLLVNDSVQQLSLKRIILEIAIQKENSRNK